MGGLRGPSGKAPASRGRMEPNTAPQENLFVESVETKKSVQLPPGQLTLEEGAAPQARVRAVEIPTSAVAESPPGAPVLRQPWMCPICEEWIPKGTSTLRNGPIRWAGRSRGGWAHFDCLHPPLSSPASRVSNGEVSPEPLCEAEEEVSATVEPQSHSATAARVRTRVRPAVSAPAVRELSNESEESCYRLLRERGAEVFHRGYPDFWWVEDGQVCFVEVKRQAGTPFKLFQRQFLDAVRAHGCRTFRYDPEQGLAELK